MHGEPVRGGLPDPAFFSLSGLEQARAYLRGLVPRPPLSHLVGYQVTQVGPGTATATMPASRWLLDPGDTIQLSVLLEGTLHLAALTAAAPGMDVSTVTLTTSYVRPAGVESESFLARARVVNSGRTYTLVEAVAEDARGRPLAQSTASLITRPLSPSPPPLASPLEPVPEPAYPTPNPYLRPAPDSAALNLPDEDDWLAVFTKFASGELPQTPALQLLGGRFVDVGEGRATAVLRTSDWLCWMRRVVAPGVLAYIGLIGLNGAVVTGLPPGPTQGILNLNFSFLRPVVPDGREVVARGTLIHRSGDLLVSTVEMTDADGNRVAVGQETAVLRQPRGRTVKQGQRLLLTVLFTDIVDSTGKAQALGDDAWRNVLSEHDALVRKQLELFKGKEVKSTGDGFLATFESPARAIHCARAIQAGVQRLGLEVRAGIHTGECEDLGSDVAGIAVHFAARLLALAAPGEVLVSATTRDLVAGSGLQFASRGAYELKGIEARREVFAVIP